jgi:hypothetical protein
VNEYTTQELLEKVQLADSLFDQGKSRDPSSPLLGGCFLTSFVSFTLFLCSSYRPRPRPATVVPVSAPQEATLDSAFLVTASNMHAAKARAMKAGGGAFDIDDFVSKLITFMGGRRGGGGGGAGANDSPAASNDVDDDDDDDDDEPLDWQRIGRKALAKSRRVPVMDFMCVSFVSLSLSLSFQPTLPFRTTAYLTSWVARLGPLAVEQKKRVVGKRARFEKNKADERRPQELREEDIARSENETTKHVIDVSSQNQKSKNPLVHAGAGAGDSFFALKYRFEPCSWSRTVP